MEDSHIKFSHHTLFEFALHNQKELAEPRIMKQYFAHNMQGQQCGNIGFVSYYPVLAQSSRQSSHLASCGTYYSKYS